ncbi:MAG: MATE family efflux transporter [Bacteroides sp.]|nr:MATE family efflux transporter [Bacteroides sp.]
MSSRINREILSLAVPSIITNITTPLLALMDVAIVGHMGDASYIAAIAIGGTVFNMIYWLFAFLRMGTSGMSAQAHGADDGHELDLVLTRGMLVALSASLLIIVLSPLIGRIAFSIMDVSGDVAVMAGKYFSILVWGAPAVLSTYTLSGWTLGRKNPKAPMWVSFIINIGNILVSLLLVYGFGMKIEGVAVGTLSSQWLGALSFIIIVVHRYRPEIPALGEILQSRAIRRFFSVNADIFLRTCCLIAVTVWFTRVGSGQGVTVLAVNTLLMQFFILFSYFMDGFAFAGESLCGNCLGAADRPQLHRCIRALIGWGAGVAVIFTTIYYICGEWIMQLLSSDNNVIDASKEYFNWVLLIPAVGFLAFTWDGVYIGITRTREMLMSMLFSTAIYFILYATLYPHLGNHGLWIAFLSYLLTRGIVLHVLSKRVEKKIFLDK